MSDLFRIFNTSASALTAQSVRLNTVASNMANAATTSSTAEDTSGWAEASSGSGVSSVLMEG